MKTPLLLSVVVVLIVACTREKIIDQESTYIREPVVNCLITPEKEFSLFLNWSMQGGDANQLADTIKNALVTVYESGRKLGDITYDVTLKKYSFSGLYPKVQTSYSLEISIPGFDKKVSASTYVPNPVEIVDIVPGILQERDQKYIDFSDYDSYVTRQKIRVKQDPKKKEYMMLSHEIRPYTVMSPRDFLIDNRYFEQPDVYRNETACIFMFDDRFMTQEFSEIEINTESFYAGSTASNFESTDIVLLTIAPELYFYHSTYLCHGKSCDSEIPIDMSVDASEVYSNITNGLGIFAAYSKSRFALTPVSLTHN